MKNKIFGSLLIMQLISLVGFGQWTNRFNGTGDFSDQYNDVTSDVSGNIFACGYSVNPGTNKDILVVKMNALGNVLWSNVYDGPGSGIDEAIAIAVDVSGNVYITGSQRGSSTGTDMVTIKYDSSGVIQWVQPYLFGSDESDRGTALVVDGLGNVYVTGRADTDPTSTNNDDYISIKYDLNGNQLWIATENGVGNGADKSVQIALGNANNVVVTGSSSNGADDDYLTISYDISNGAKVWESRIDRANNDRATGLVIDQNNGNIYVTGRSKNITYDYLTVAYDTLGNLLWQKVYDYIADDRATSIALNANGELYVTGQSDFDPTTNFNYNITTLKYSAIGTQLWVSTYANSNGLDDVPSEIVVDNLGNAFITGYNDTDPTTLVRNDLVFIGYNTNGGSLFQNTYSQTVSHNDQGNAAYVDPSNNIIVVGFSELIPEKSALVQKYNGSGTRQWSNFYNGEGDNTSSGLAIAVDANYNSFVAGYTVQYGTDRDFYLQKIDAQGNTVWFRTLNGSSTGSIDEAVGVAIDALGNIFVGGFLKNSSVSNDYCVAKYNQLGSLLWMKTYNNPIANESDKATSLALDNQGNVFLTGKSDSDSTITSNVDLLTVKWNTNGVFQWAKRYNGVGNGTDLANQIVVAPSGNSYVAGKTNNGLNSDCILIKYNPAGVQQWVYVYDGSGEDEINGLVLDNAENCYLTGGSESSPGVDTNMVTIKVNTSGVEQWVSITNGAGGGTDIGVDIALDNSQNVVVCGNTDSDNVQNTRNNDVAVVKFDPLGTILWSVIYDDAFNSDDVASNIGVDNQNNVFVTSQSNFSGDPTINYDYVTVKFLADGTQDSELVVDGTGASKDSPNALFINGPEVYITGRSNNINQQRDVLTVKYFGVPNAGLLSMDSQLATFQIYPNPTDRVANINFSEMPESHWPIQLIVADVSGSTVYKTQLTHTKSLAIDCENLFPGIYFVTAIASSGNSACQKLIIK